MRQAIAGCCTNKNFTLFPANSNTPVVLFYVQTSVFATSIFVIIPKPYIFFFSFRKIKLFIFPLSITSNTVFCLIKTSLTLLTATTVQLSQVLESREFPFWWNYKPVRTELSHEASAWGLGVSLLCSTVCRAYLWRKHTIRAESAGARATPLICRGCLWWHGIEMPALKLSAPPQKATYSLKALGLPPLVPAE